MWSAWPNQEGSKKACHEVGRSWCRHNKKAAVVLNRLTTYKNQSEPCLAYYVARGVVRDIDGLGSIDDVFGRIATIFKK